MAQTLKQRIQSTILEVERIVAGKHNDNPGTVALKHAIAVLRECAAVIANSIRHPTVPVRPPLPPEKFSA